MAATMIEITEIAKETIKVITPVLLVGGKEIIKGAASDLWKFIKDLAKNKDEENVIEEFNKSPADAHVQEKLLTFLESKLNSDSDLMVRLTEKIKTVEASEDYKNYVSQIGDNNISLTGKINNSTINISK